ncbi:MAG: nodulation protein NfeD [Acidobacteriota bacterium]|nr:nodulation protein NfeD [Acidobacteriota bacterium]
MRVVALAAVMLLAGVSSIEANAPVVRLVDFENRPITPATAKRILNAIDDAEEQGNDLILIQLDTPGGLVSTMTDIVKRILASEVPVVVWVGPSGSHAASAGFFVLLSADVATMAPGTRTGAASTVYGSGGESKEGDVMLEKINKDHAALLRSIITRRAGSQEAVDAAEKAVFSAEAFSETEALDLGLIDFVAGDLDEVLEGLDGREITRFDGTTVVVQTAGARFVSSEIDFRQKLFEFLADPIVAYVLLMLGMLGIYIEMSNPGLVFPAVVGALCLILGAFAMQFLPVSTIGALLIVLAIVMFILEIKVTSFGMLTVGGGLCLVIGSLMLFDGPIPALRLPPSLVIPIAVVFVGVVAVAMRFVIAAQRARVATGVEGLVGEVGTVTRDGMVFVHGELWEATTQNGPLPVGTRVRVLKAEGLRLTVERVADDRPEGN